MSFLAKTIIEKRMITMKKTQKYALKQAFEPPQPQRKREFIAGLPPRHVPISRFLWQQFGYIRKRVWLVDIAVTAAAVILSRLVPGEVVAILSAVTPALAVCYVSESSRSREYGMWELEMCARFSLKSVLLSKFVLLGLVNAAVFCVMIPAGMGTASAVRTAVYLICPYLLTSFLGLLISRKSASKEAMYFIVGIAALLGVAVLLSQNVIYAPQNFNLWLSAFVLLAVENVLQSIKTIKQTEEM